MNMVVLHAAGDRRHVGLIFAFKKCTSGSPFVERMVSIACRSPIVHVDIVPYCGRLDPSAHGFSPSQCIAFAAFMFRRFSMRTPDYPPEEWSCMYLPLDDYSYSLACDWLTSALNTRYDYTSLPLCLTPISRLRIFHPHDVMPSSLFCSEACVILLNHIKRLPGGLDRAIPSSISPALLHRIMRSNPNFSVIHPV